MNIGAVHNSYIRIQMLWRCVAGDHQPDALSLLGGRKQCSGLSRATEGGYKLDIIETRIKIVLVLNRIGEDYIVSRRAEKLKS